MAKIIKVNLHLIITALFLMSAMPVVAESLVPANGEPRQRFDRFCELLDNGTPEAFYDYAKDYEQFLLGRGDSVLYYKTVCNEGFFALRHRQLFHAMRFARKLDADVRKAGAKDYYYLSTGLTGDIYADSHDSRKAEYFYLQAIEEAGDRDPKFSIITYMSLAEMLSLKDSEEALEWADKSLALAKKEDNEEYLCMSVAMKAYVEFLIGDEASFRPLYEQYTALRQKKDSKTNSQYDNIMETVNMAFNKDYDGAFRRVHQGQLNVDSSLVVIRIYAMQGDIRNGFQAMKRRYIEMDSIFSDTQNAHFDEMTAERNLLKSREEAEANKKMVRKLTNWIIGMTVVFLFIYIMGRRRLVRKIWARNRQLKDALAHAEESDIMKSAFIRNMSHEIRTPLNAINGFSQVLCTPGYDLDDDMLLDLKNRISDNVDKITAIVNELLDLSKGESELTKEAVMPVAICHEVVQQTQLKNTKGLDIRFTTTLSDDFTFQCHADNLRRILLQLMDNGIKFTNEGFVELACRYENGAMTFTVSDTGVGIEEKERERVFENFVKLDEYKGGVGLGLSVCRRLARVLGGDVTIDNEYSGGARFILTLPLK